MLEMEEHTLNDTIDKDLVTHRALSFWVFAKLLDPNEEINSLVPSQLKKKKKYKCYRRSDELALPKTFGLCAWTTTIKAI